MLTHISSLRALVCLGLFAVLAIDAAAQTSTVVVRGRVVDEQGAALPGASVTARNTSTAVTRSVLTESQGQFFIPNLQPGAYEVTANLAGFATAKQSGLVLRVGQEATVDFTLKVSGVAEEITVSADTPVLETTRSTIGTIINKDQIDALPVLDRDFASLAKLSPGVTTGVGGNGESLSFNGQHGFTNGFFVDGASAEWNYYGKQSSTFVQDWIQEFQVLTNSFPAEFGTASGGIINAVTRSGGNEFHGRAYGFFRDDALDSGNFAGFFENGEPEFLDGGDKPELSQKRLGAFLSGPLVKNKLFFFAGYERFRRDSSEALGITQYWRDRGVSPTVVPLEGRDNPFMVKLDADVNHANHLSLRYDYTKRIDTNQSQFGSATDTEEVRYAFGGPIWNVVGQWTSTVGNSKFNEFRAVYGSNKPPIICNKSGTGGQENLRERPGTFSTQIYPGATFGCPVFTGLEGEQTLQLIDNFSFVKGNHQFKVGGQAYRIRTLVDATNFSDGFWVFDQDLAFDRNDPASFPSVFQGNIGLIQVDTALWNFYGYMQDTWQLNDKWVLNLGLRYDLDNGVKGGNEFVDAKNAQLVARYGGTAPLVKTKTDSNNFSPRFGIVYTPDAAKRTTLRLALGRFYDQNHSNFNAIYYANTLLADRFIVFDANDPFSWGPFGSPEALRLFLAQAFPFYPDLSLAPAPSDIINRNDPNLQVSYTDQVTGGVGHDFGNGLSVDADFVYARGEEIPIYIDENVAFVNGQFIQVDRRFNTVATLKNVGWSRYKALLTQARYRRGRGNVELSYTLSKATSNNNTNIFGNSPTNPLDLSEDEGPDTTDRRHNLVVNANYTFPLDFQIAGIWTLRSAAAYSATQRFNSDPDDPFNDRPEPRNSRRGDSFNTVDLRLSKAFKLGGGVRITAFWEMFNAFNTTNFNTFFTRIDIPDTFGMPNSAFDKRRQQGGLRLDF